MARTTDRGKNKDLGTEKRMCLECIRNRKKASAADNSKQGEHNLNKDLLYSTGNYAQYLVITYNVKESKKNIYIHIYN